MILDELRNCMIEDTLFEYIESRLKPKGYELFLRAIPTDHSIKYYIAIYKTGKWKNNIFLFKPNFIPSDNGEIILDLNDPELIKKIDEFIESC